MSIRPRPPFQERNSFWRGPLDLVTGAYPGFLFGRGVVDDLPVFHFHEVHPDHLEPYFSYLAENHYHTLTSDVIDRFARGVQHPGKNAVAITFDDAWASFRVVAYPLLIKYGLKAVLFVSPGRIASNHPPSDEGPNAFHPALDRTEPMFCSWPELREMHASGLVDIQAHGYLHAKIACHPDPLRFIKPGDRFHPHEIPLVDTPNGPRLAGQTDAGLPVFPMRSRLSDALRWTCPEATEACREMATRLHQTGSNERPELLERLSTAYRKASRGRFETDEERDQAIREDLKQARQELEQQIDKKVQHLCFPWAIAGSAARRIAEEEGYRSAFSDRLGGYRAVRAGDPPYQLMRLKHEFIFCLPGKERTWFFGKKPAPAHRGLDLLDPLLPETRTKA